MFGGERLVECLDSLHYKLDSAILHDLSLPWLFLPTLPRQYTHNSRYVPCRLQLVLSVSAAVKVVLLILLLFWFLLLRFLILVLLIRFLIWLALGFFI